MRFNKKWIGGGLAALALATACTAGMTGTALAASSTWPVPTAPMTNTVTASDGTVKTVVTASANGCYRTFPEILGLSNPLCNPGSGAKQTDAAEALTAMTTDPDYGLYGSPANNSPDAYMWNYYYNFYAAANGLDKADPTVTCITCNAGAAGFDTTAVAAYGGINAAFYHRPDIAYGIGTVNEDGTSTYSAFVDKIHTFTSNDEWYHAGDETYNPYLVDCRGDYGTKLFHVQTLYDLAEAAENVIKDSNNTKTTRYGDDPYEYAVEFEKLVRGTNYTVLKAIDEKKVAKKTVAYVTTVDTDTNTFNTMYTDTKTTSFEEVYQGVWGGTCIRFMYAPNILENITNNIGEVNKLQQLDNGLYVASAKDLMDCDAIMVRTGNGMGDCDASADQIKEILRAAGYTDESKWPDMYYTYPTFPGGGGGNYAYVSYYATMVSFVYPEILNPAELDAYYCQTVYHVASSYLEDAMNILFAKASLPSGYSIDLSGYSYEKVSKTLNSGLLYYAKNKAAIDAEYPNLVMTDYLAANVDKYAAEDDTITVTPAKATVKAAKGGKVTVKVAGATSKLTVAVAKAGKKAGIKAKANSKAKVTITVPKKCKKGTYKVTIKSDTSATKTVKVTVK